MGLNNTEGVCGIHFLFRSVGSRNFGKKTHLEGQTQTPQCHQSRVLEISCSKWSCQYRRALQRAHAPTSWFPIVSPILISCLCSPACFLSDASISSCCSDLLAAAEACYQWRCRALLCAWWANRLAAGTAADPSSSEVDVVEGLAGESVAHHRLDTQRKY